MRRRAFLLAEAGALFTAGGAGHAQRGDKVRRIGFLQPGMSDPGYTPLRQGLGAVGFVVDNIHVIEERFASDRTTRTRSRRWTRQHALAMSGLSSPTCKALKIMSTHSRQRSAIARPGS